MIAQYRPDIFACRLVVFDLDGTLHREGPVRGAMLAALLFTGARPNPFDRLRILRRFRQLREEFATRSPKGFDAALCRRLATENAMRRQGMRVAIWSDYPVGPKLTALGARCDLDHYSIDPEIDAREPDPAGLLHAMSRSGSSDHETLMVEDRRTRDGAAASAAGVDFLLKSDRPHRGLCASQFQVSDFSGLVETVAALRA